MPFYERKNTENNARIGFWHAVESEASLRAGHNPIARHDGQIASSRSSRRRSEILAARRLMHRMGISDSDLYYGPEGKPYLKSGDVSISHTSHVVCVAVSHYPIGIDIQKRSAKLSRVAAWFLHARELKVERHDNLLRLSLIWAAKEALFKLVGNPGISLRDFYVRIPREINDSGSFAGILTKEQKIRFRLYDGPLGQIRMGTCALRRLRRPGEINAGKALHKKSGKFSVSLFFQTSNNILRTANTYA